MGLKESVARLFGLTPIDYYALQQRAPAKAQPVTNPPAFLRADAVA